MQSMVQRLEVIHEKVLEIKAELESMVESSKLCIEKDAETDLILNQLLKHAKVQDTIMRNAGFNIKTVDSILADSSKPGTSF